MQRSNCSRHLSLLLFFALLLLLHRAFISLLIELPMSLLPAQISGFMSDRSQLSRKKNTDHTETWKRGVRVESNAKQQLNPVHEEEVCAVCTIHISEELLLSRDVTVKSLAKGDTVLSETLSSTRDQWTMDEETGHPPPPPPPHRRFIGLK